MKKTAILLAALLGLSGCAGWQAMSDDERKHAMWIAGGIVTVAIVAAAVDGDTTIVNNGCGRHGNDHTCD